MKDVSLDRRRRVTANRAVVLVKHLISTASSRAQMVEVTGWQPATVSAWLDAMREAKLVALCDWENDARGYPTIELFRWAPDEPDAVKQVRTRAEQMRDWRASKKAEVVS